ncbi:MAG: hypothetical protein AAFY45_26840 [Bacteroidota bacterium]
MTYFRNILLFACLVGLLMLFGGFGSLITSSELEPDRLQNENELIEGAWELTQIRGESAKDLNIRMVKIISGGHFSFAFFNDDSQQFFSAGGGTYSYANGRYSEHIEFHTISPELAGTSIHFTAEFKDNTWQHTGSINGEPLEEVYQRIDEGAGLDHVGSWEIFRLSNEGGKMVPQQKGMRTIKLLSGSRFQWATWDERKGEFIGTGGGTYDTQEGYYTENIEFFSRDSIRVGKSITFGCDIKGNTWHHEEYAGSRGLQINEIWIRMQ